jgi:hypothetical protein
VPVLPKALFALVRSNLVAFPFFTAGHSFECLNGFENAPAADC